MLRTLTREDGTLRVHVHADVGIVNAIRRALIMDVPRLAPSHVVIDVNTSCATDEFLAHRIGQIIFRSTSTTGEKEVAKLHVKGRCVLASDVIGTVTPSHPETMIIQLTAEQELRLSVHFDVKTGAEHARYSHVHAVAYQPVDAAKAPKDAPKGEASSVFELRFSTNDPSEDAARYLLVALESLYSRLERLRDTVQAVER